MRSIIRYPICEPQKAKSIRIICFATTVSCPPSTPLSMALMVENVPPKAATKAQIFSLPAKSAMVYRGGLPVKMVLNVPMVAPPTTTPRAMKNSRIAVDQKLDPQLNILNHLKIVLFFNYYCIVHQLRIKINIVRRLGMEIYYIDRKTKEKKKEIVAGEKLIKWAYESNVGMTLSELVFKRKFLSYYYGKLQDRPSSAKKIKQFIKELDIDMTEAIKEKTKDYKNFNEFFIRELKPGTREVVQENALLASPADGRVFAYEHIDINRILQVKGMEYSLQELFGDHRLAQRFQGGTYYIIRLCPADYHRFHFCDNGIPKGTKKIKGYYYSVNPLALRKVAQLYCKNKREITLFDTDNFGTMAFVEVGAAAVGTIVQTFTHGTRVSRGDEKGYFKFGGSTVILFFEKGKVKVDEDILENTEAGYETKINMGERIGCKK